MPLIVINYIYSIIMEVIDGSSALAKTGRITQLENSKVVTYKVTITNKTNGVSESITLSSVIEGTNSK